ncbi:uncharacterized protein F4807DRAFT_448295 [Annulohypoxylon truncatum]|uniref:uncharacterized protein n=1 Tax=Annulohypoxylon truncatum TaxID=327061 RepID=UPI002007607F|nr:uncharacterized protein F4807DRAFT_448295 [Annulohypoxylon truncatum]KAI1204242.1 hypothetical protein F4807DRAFT_448295 [Annulohypoxylon truncatum]
MNSSDILALADVIFTLLWINVGSPRSPCLHATNYRHSLQMVSHHRNLRSPSRESRKPGRRHMHATVLYIV